jgi:hypothetical protein
MAFPRAAGGGHPRFVAVSGIWQELRNRRCDVGCRRWCECARHRAWVCVHQAGAVGRREPGGRCGGNRGPEVADIVPVGGEAGEYADMVAVSGGAVSKQWRAHAAGSARCWGRLGCLYEEGWRWDVRPGHWLRLCIGWTTVSRRPFRRSLPCRWGARMSLVKLVGWSLTASGTMCACMLVIRLARVSLRSWRCFLRRSRTQVPAGPRPAHRPPHRPGPARSLAAAVRRQRREGRAFLRLGRSTPARRVGVRR